LDLDGKEPYGVRFRRHFGQDASLAVETHFSPTEVRVAQTFSKVEPDAIRLQSVLVNESGKTLFLTRVRLVDSAAGAKILLSRNPRLCRKYEQGNYWSNVRWLEGRDISGKGESESASSLCWLCFGLESRIAFCLGFETVERWQGQIHTSLKDGKVRSWSVGFDGADVEVDRDEEVRMEDVLLLVGADPWDLSRGTAT